MLHHIGYYPDDYKIMTDPNRHYTDIDNKNIHYNKTVVAKRLFYKGFLPSKAKFTKEEIINADLKILRERDISAVAARGIGIYFGCFARPIFTVFENRGEVLDDLSH